MTRLTYAPDAQSDLREIARHIAVNNPDRAQSFVAELRAKAAQAAARPHSFRRRDDLAPGIRAALHGRYVILFREVDDGVRIVNVLHGAQDIAGKFAR